MITWMVAMALLFQTPRYKWFLFCFLKRNDYGKRKHIQRNQYSLDFPGGPVLKTPSVTTAGTGLIPGWRTKILHTTWSRKVSVGLPSWLSG